MDSSLLHGPAKHKPLRPPVYVNQLLPDHTTIVRMKKSPEHGEGLFKHAGDNKRKTNQLKQQVAHPVNFSIVGNSATDTGHHPTEHNRPNTPRLAEKPDHQAPAHSQRSSGAYHYTSPRTLLSAESFSGNNENGENNEANVSITLNGVSVDKSLRQAEASRARRENSEPLKSAPQKQTEGDNNRKQAVPLAQKTHYTESSHALLPSLPERPKSLTEDVAMDAEYTHFQRRRSMTSKAYNSLSSIQTGGTKIPMVERVTLESEISRLKTMVMPDFAKELLLGKFTLPKEHSSQKEPSSYSVQRFNKMLEEQKQKVPTFMRGISQAQSEMYLSELYTGDEHQHDMNEVFHEMRSGLSKRELSCLKHHLLPPIGRETAGSLIDLPEATLSVKTYYPRVIESRRPSRAPLKIDTAQLTVKTEEVQSFAVGARADEPKATPKKQGKRSNPSDILQSIRSLKRRFSRSLPTDSIIVRRYSKGKLKPPKQGTEDDADHENEAKSDDSHESSRNGSSDPRLRFHPVTEEPTLVDSFKEQEQKGYEVAATVKSFQSGRSSLAIPNSISRASLAPPSELDAKLLSDRSRVSGLHLKPSIDTRLNRVTMMLRHILQQLHYYAQPQQDRMIVIPRNELLTRFKKLDTNGDGQLSFAQLEAGLSSMSLSNGQKQYIRAIYNAVTRSCGFGFDEFSGVYVLCSKLDSLNSETAKQTYEQLDGYALEAALEFFLGLFESTKSSYSGNTKSEEVLVEKLLDTFNASETLHHASEYLTLADQLRKSGASDESNHNPVMDLQLQVIKQVFIDENLTHCDQLHFALLIPLFLVIFKPDKYRVTTRR